MALSNFTFYILHFTIFYTFFSIAPSSFYWILVEFLFFINIFHLTISHWSQFSASNLTLTLDPTMWSNKESIQTGTTSITSQCRAEMLCFLYAAELNSSTKLWVRLLSPDKQARLTVLYISNRLLWSPLPFLSSNYSLHSTNQDCPDSTDQSKVSLCKRPQTRDIWGSVDSLAFSTSYPILIDRMKSSGVSTEVSLFLWWQVILIFTAFVWALWTDWRNQFLNLEELSSIQHWVFPSWLPGCQQLWFDDSYLPAFRSAASADIPQLSLEA